MASNPLGRSYLLGDCSGFLGNDFHRSPRVTGGRTAYAHNIRRIGADHYRLSWSFDTKIAGSRLRWPRTITRDTDEAGAMRFARKWGCSMPTVGGNRQ
jgi:hypothetical protein